MPRMDPRYRRSLIERLTRDAEQIAGRFDVKYLSIEAERANVKRRYGICYEDGTIKIRLVHAVTGAPLKYSSLVNTLCHELAHLRHFNHGARFQALYGRMLEWARSEGIYRPGAPDDGPRRVVATAVIPRGHRRRPEPSWQPPQQLDLFASGDRTSR